MILFAIIVCAVVGIVYLMGAEQYDQLVDDIEEVFDAY